MVLSLDQWIGKVAVVTGASAGIGAEISKQLVEAGIIVVGLARRAEKVQELAKNLSKQKGKLYAVKCDITSEKDVKRAFEEIEKIGPVHILINNAGTLAHTTLCSGEVDKWRQVLETNVMGTCIVSKEAIRVMSQHKIAGQIININSILGHYVYDIPRLNVYPASKHALTALTETLRLELIGIDSKIKVTSLSPGPVDDTEFFVRQHIGTEEGQGPIKHLIKPDDVADGVIYILSTPPHLQSLSPGPVDDTEFFVRQHIGTEEGQGPIKHLIKPDDVADGVIYILSTPPHLQVAELMLRPVGERL